MSTATGHLRLLLGLRFRLLWRQLTARTSRIVSTLLLLLVITPLSIFLGLGAAALTGLLLDSGSTTGVREWIHLIYLAVFVFLSLSPVLGFRGSEFYDVTKLFLYPVRQKTVFVAVALGHLTSGTVLFFLPLLLFPLLRLPGGAGLVALRFVGAAVFLFLAVALGQMLVYAMLNLLRSRRFRDLAMLAGPLIGGAVYLATRAASFGGRSWLFDLAVHRPSQWFRFSPSYWISLVVGAPEGPRLADLLPMLLGALPLTVLVVSLSTRLQEKAFLGELRVSSPAAGIRTRRRSALRRFLGRFVPADLRAIAGRELVGLRREPMVKTLLVHQSAFFLVPVVLAMFGLGGALEGPSALAYLHFLPVMLLVVEQTILLNNLGLEGEGFVHLAATPIPRGRILLGKNLAHLALFGAANSILVLSVAAGMAAVVENIDLSTALEAGARDAFAGLLALIVVVALGNVVSPIAPTRLTVKGLKALRQQHSGKEGCGIAIFRLTGLLVSLLSLLPVAILLYLPELIPSLGSWFYAISVPVAIAYAGGALVGSLQAGASVLRRREHRLLDFFGRSSE
jgi:hypothetical protein